LDWRECIWAFYPFCFAVPYRRDLGTCSGEVPAASLKIGSKLQENYSGISNVMAEAKADIKSKSFFLFVRY
jgi:hypothetical protein